MREQAERSGFPKTGDYLSFAEFWLKVPAGARDRVYGAQVKGKPGLYNYALFPAPVQRTEEQAQLIATAEKIAAFVPENDSTT